MKKIILIFIVLIFLQGCLYAVRYDGTYRGKVVDAETGEPIEGVVLLGVWYTEVPTVAGPQHDYYDAKETVTDENGEFEIHGKGLRVMSNLEPMRVTIFKAGYTYYDEFPWESLKEIVRWEEGRAIIRLKKLTMEERRRQQPPYPPTEAVKARKIKLLTDEINKDRKERGLKVKD